MIANAELVQIKEALRKSGTGGITARLLDTLEAERERSSRLNEGLSQVIADHNETKSKLEAGSSGAPRRSIRS
jgi:hypothetical protein